MIVVLAGVSAALHVAKLPPAIAALQAGLGISLLQAGFLLSLVQLAGMSVGVAFGVFADGMGLKRSMVVGSLLLGAASALGGAVQAVPVLMALRALEGFGFLLVVLPAPGLLRQNVPRERLNLMLGVWSAYMPFGAAAALLLGPWCIAALGWRGWWWLLAGLSLAMVPLLWHAVPAAAPPTAARQASAAAWWSRLRRTLAVPGPWWVALSFCVYAGPWLSVIGFLPTIYADAGVSGAAAGALSALAAAVNIAGNLLAGRLMHGGVAPTRLLRIGFATMAAGALAAFGTFDGATLPAVLRYAAVLLFSAIGGLVPATLFALAVRVAPSDDTLSTTVGWVQQWSALGQFTLPPVVAWVAGQAGGWQWTWGVTGACALAGIVLSARIARRLRQ